MALYNPLIQQGLGGLYQPLEMVMLKRSGFTRLPACSGWLTLPDKVSRCHFCSGDKHIPSDPFAFPLPLLNIKGVRLELHLLALGETGRP